METKEVIPLGKQAVIRRLGVAYVLLGLSLLTSAVVGLREDIEWIAQPFYAWVWWGYIFVLDGFCAWKRGDSLLTTRLKYFIPICVWSVTFWFFFELINARIQNWYYVEVFPLNASLSGALFALVAFATVFMGIFQTIDALTASGLWKDWKGRPHSFNRRLTYLLQCIGLAMGGLALLFPHYLAPLIWGSFTLLVDPWNYRRGTRSLLRDIEMGDFGLIGRVLLGGLICGIVWESLNFFAPQKWIYTVRGLEGLKLFEMPLLGFLGFPALALDSMAGFALCSSWFLGNRSWERSQDLSYALHIRRVRSKRLFSATVVIQLLFCALVSQHATPINVASVQVELRDLGLTPREESLLRQRAIHRPRQFLRSTNTDEEQAIIRQALNWTTPKLDEIRRRARLYTFKGIGRDHGRLLEETGIRTPEDLISWSPDELHQALSSFEHPVRTAPPRLDFVRVWILAAHDQDIIMTGR